MSHVFWGLFIGVLGGFLLNGSGELASISTENFNLRSRRALRWALYGGGSILVAFGLALVFAG